MSVRAILQCLADGEFHSGADLGKLLGVSRTAVWKHLQKLEAYGLVLESVKGKGYRLPGGLQLLDESAISSQLSPEAASSISELDVRDIVDSTNQLAMARASQGRAGGYVCLAEFQSQGRGRRGRTWVSPFGQSLYLSAVMEFANGAAALEGLSLAVGVALVRALRSLGVPAGGVAEGHAEQGAEDYVRAVQLKWPNDVVVNGRKLAGVLLEMTGDPAGHCQVVVGVGLNVCLSSAAEAAIDQPWINLQALLPNVSRNRLVAEVLNQLMPLLSGFESQGFSRYRQEWEQYHAHAGRSVKLLAGAQAVEGVALGVTDGGALCLMVDGEVQEFHGGEVSLREVPVA